MFIQANFTYRIKIREEEVMKTGVLGALVALSAYLAMIGVWSVAFSAEPGSLITVLAGSEARIDSVDLSSGQDALSSSDGELTASKKWPFEIFSILFVGIVLLTTGRLLRAHRRHQRANAGELKEMFNGGVSV
jgi:hypothetical protein